jgi:hypothetical protein
MLGLDLDIGKVNLLRIQSGATHCIMCLSGTYAAADGKQKPLSFIAQTLILIDGCLRYDIRFLHSNCCLRSSKSVSLTHVYAVDRRMQVRAYLEFSTLN